MNETDLDGALEGSEAARLLDDFGISREFVLRNVVSASGPVTVSQLAMRWMGMPNKHDRKRVRQLMDALASAGVVQRVAEDTYKPL